MEIIRKLVQDIEVSYIEACNHSKKFGSSHLYISLQFPLDGFVKINTDGAARAYKAKLWGILHGLEVTWNAGYRRVILESDSLTAINVLTKQDASVREERLISHIRMWIGKDWEVQVQHTFTEGNMCADWLAIYLLNSEEQADQISFEEPPCGIFLLFMADLASVGREHVVTLSC
ncbi:uncharacterized protein LOC133310604 [Gastrolobium bilobum]|uniref:uncharacterized protein LOC133310604 n=1 Tax=Gastrolobium bilobum TaxID=150636 RepID=UPI002AB2163C|nr:uncharacterized protein LOC133310604 [Gastrolobium bilobum]